MAKLRNPTFGYDATGADAYAALATPIAAPTVAYTRLVAACATHPAVLSFDAGVTDHAGVVPGATTILEGVEITGAIQAKNANAGSNFTNLVVMVW